MIRKHFAWGAVAIALWTCPSMADQPNTDTNSATAPQAEEQTQKLSSATQAASAPGYLRQANPKPQSQIGGRSEPSMGRITLSLFLVALLGGIALYAKRRKGGTVNPLRTQVRLHTLSTLQVGPKSKISLVSVGREAMLLGISEQGVTCLRTYPEDELWSLTASLPGFSDLEKEEEVQAKLARRPGGEKSLMERGMEQAFSDLLTRANKSERVVLAADRASSQKVQKSDSAEPDDQYVPSDFAEEKKSSAKNAEEDFPPHLAALLKEASLPMAKTARTVTPKQATNVVRLHREPDEQFGEPEGQAAELMRRFAELKA